MRGAVPRAHALVAFALLVGAFVAGCAAPAPPSPEPPGVVMMAVDGRWPVSDTLLRTLGDDAGWGVPAGGAFFGGGIARHANATFAVDYVALDEGAASLVSVPVAAAGDIILNGTFARAHGLVPGDEVTVRVTSFPPPLVSSAFEMERIRSCDKAPDAILCLLPSAANASVLRLVVGVGTQDLAFVPEGAELGPGGIPAWWNGTLSGPTTSLPFHASLLANGSLTVGEIAGPIDPGEWRISFRLESARHALDGAVAGIVRIREPGYGWFDDRLVAQPSALAQARTLRGWAHANERVLRIAGFVESPLPGGVALLSPADARALVDAPLDAHGALLYRDAPGRAASLAVARNASARGEVGNVRARPLPAGPLLGAASRGALLYRAPPDIDPTSLPRVDGAGAPTLAILLESPVGETPATEGKPVPGLRILAHAGPGAPPWTLPPGGRWTTADDALDNISRSRTLVLSTPDWSKGALQSARVALGDERAGRVVVAVEHVEGGPERVAWASPSLVAGAGKPQGAVIVLPLDPGSDARDVLRRADLLWSPLGLASEPLGES